MEEQRFQQQEELERQRIEQERQRFEQESKMNQDRMQRERQLDQERFRQQERLDRERTEQERQWMEQERRLNQERFGRGIQLQAGQQGPIGDLRDPSGLLPGTLRVNSPTRGFFTNSPTGQLSDIDKIIDPTSLAVLGILLTLVATSLSLVKGS